MDFAIALIESDIILTEDGIDPTCNYYRKTSAHLTNLKPFKWEVTCAGCAVWR